MASRGTYHTKQRAHIQSCLASHGDRYLTVREVCSLLEDAGTPCGLVSTICTDAHPLAASAPPLPSPELDVHSRAGTGTISRDWSRPAL